MKKSGGCTFGLVLEQRVNGMEKTMEEGFDRIDVGLKEIKVKNEQMFNHLSDRPTKQSARMINLLISAGCTLLGALLVFIAAVALS